MRRRTVLAGAVLTTALTATGCFGQAGDGASGDDPPVLSGIRLISFDACDDLLGWVKGAALERVGPYGFEGLAGDLGGGFGSNGTDMARSAEMMSSGAATAAPSADAAPATTVAGMETDAMGAGASGPGDAVSGTNTVEAGVDEPDLVKTDGERIVALARGRLQVLSPGAGTPTLLGSLYLPPDTPADQLLLHGDRVLLVASAYGVRPLARTPGIAPDFLEPGGVPKAVLREVDISDPASPRITATLEVEGSLVDTRVVDGIARVVVRSQPAGLDFVYPSGPGAEEAAAELNRGIVEDSTIEQWLPSYALETGGQQSTGAAVECNQVHHPAEFSGFSLLSVLTIDLAAGLSPGAGAGVLADGQRVYASPESLYVALDQYPASDVPTIEPAFAPDGSDASGAEPGSPGSADGPDSPAASSDSEIAATAVPSGPAETTTAVHKFTIAGAEPAVYAASGTVTGILLNDYSMSEYEGVLRVATTVGAGWWRGGDGSTSESFVTTLGQQGDQLVQLGQVGGLGLGEQIFGVRFVGPVGYVVTFRQTDPLYTVDLADPANPSVMGELKILGYSAYLHPLGDGRLLGIGQDATEEGMRTGSQVSLFDVSDLANPQRLSQLAIPDSWSSAENDRHAFLWWAATGLAVLPVDVASYNADGTPVEAFSGVVGIGVDGDQLAERGRISHPADEPQCEPMPQPKPIDPAATTDDAATTSLAAPWCLPYAPGITRSLVIGDVLYTLSDSGLQANDLQTLSPLGWLAFG